MARIVRFHRYGDPSVLKIEDLDVPPPAADEVQIEVKSIGLNRAEVMFRTHAYLQEAQFPSRLGFEAAGIVKTVGTSITSFKKGDVISLIPPTDVARWGTYGELAMCPLATSSNIRGTSLLKRRQLRGCSMSLHGAPSLSKPSSPRAISSSSQRRQAVSVLPRSKLQKLSARQSSQPLGPGPRGKRSLTTEQIMLS